MRTSVSGASAPSPIILRTDRVRRRISASDSTAALLAAIAFGAEPREDDSLLASLVACRVASYAEARRG